MPVDNRAERLITRPSNSVICKKAKTNENAYQTICQASKPYLFIVRKCGQWVQSLPHYHIITLLHYRYRCRYVNVDVFLIVIVYTD